MRDKPRWEIIHGDSLTVLESFPPGTFDAVITDPPYASGGRTQAEKSKATAKKYSSMGGNPTKWLALRISSISSSVFRNIFIS